MAVEARSAFQPFEVVDPRRLVPVLSDLISYLDGLTGRADLATLERLLGSSQVAASELQSVMKFGTRTYKRNTVARSEWFELVVLCWRSGHATPIHDHAGVSCAFKVIQGTGTEIRFRRTDSGLVCPASTCEMSAGYVCAAADEDIHQVANLQAAGADLVTLHIYSPPISRMKTYIAPAPVEALPEYEAAPEYQV